VFYNNSVHGISVISHYFVLYIISVLCLSYFTFLALWFIILLCMDYLLLPFSNSVLCYFSPLSSLFYLPRSVL
jgi:hypothetical protein